MPRFVHWEILRLKYLNKNELIRKNVRKRAGDCEASDLYLCRVLKGKFSRSTGHVGHLALMWLCFAYLTKFVKQPVIATKIPGASKINVLYKRIFFILSINLYSGNPLVSKIKCQGIDLIFIKAFIMSLYEDSMFVYLNQKFTLDLLK